MSNINKSSLVTQIQTIINGLTVATETKQRLIYLLKAAQNVGANATTISTQLQTLITTVATSEALEEVAMLINALAVMTSDRTLTVADIAALPTTATPGSVYFVESEGYPYIRRINGTWIMIEPSSQGALASPNAYAWGLNNGGQIGDGGETTYRESPVSVAGGFTDWVQISTGGLHSAGLRANGTAWSWGYNGFGRLGDGTTTDRSSPVLIAGGFTDWVQVSAGGVNAAAIRANGTAWSWGWGGGSQIGDGTTANKSSPVLVAGGFTDWIQIDVGANHTTALRANGTAWVWGWNVSGQLGDNTTTTRSSPVSVVGGFTDWVQVSSGPLHTTALRANGTAWAWGQNSYGRLGDSTITTRSSPVSVVGGFTDWVQISAGYSHTAALRANGTAWAWGRGIHGCLGDGQSNSSRSSPVSVVGGFTDWVQISAGNFRTFALRTNGTAWAWGNNYFGRLGDGTGGTYQSSPVSVVGGFTDWVQVSADTTGGHTAALRA